MRPGPDQPLAWRLKIGQQAENGVGITIGPATDRIDRTLDRTPVLSNRAMFVECIPPLVFQPILQPETALLQALQPQLPPAVADDQRIGRCGVQ